MMLVAMYGGKFAVGKVLKKPTPFTIKQTFYAG